MRTSIADGMPYAEFCKSVMNDKTGELLKNFRRHPDYDIVVPGNRDGSEMFEHLELIKNKYPEMLEYMDTFEKKQGVFGNPKKYEFPIGEKRYNLDVPIIIHIYYLALTMRYFGDLSGMKICEIGPGAGLFFKVLTDLFTDIKYTFVDLEGPLFINVKHAEYLDRLLTIRGWHSCKSLVNGSYVEKKYDLLISDCAFNELHRDVQEVYIEKLLNKSTRGRIAFYDVDINAVIPSMNIYEVFKKLDKKTKIIKMDLRVPTLYWDESKEA